MTKVEPTSLSQNEKNNIKIRPDRMASYGVISTTCGLYCAVDSFSKSTKTLKNKLSRSTGSFLKGFLLATIAITLFEVIKTLVKNRNKH